MMILDHLFIGITTVSPPNIDFLNLFPESNPVHFPTDGG